MIVPEILKQAKSQVQEEAHRRGDNSRQLASDFVTVIDGVRLLVKAVSAQHGERLKYSDIDAVISGLRDKLDTQSYLECEIKIGRIGSSRMVGFASFGYVAHGTRAPGNSAYSATEHRSPKRDRSR